MFYYSHWNLFTVVDFIHYIVLSAAFYSLFVGYEFNNRVGR